MDCRNWWTDRVGTGRPSVGKGGGDDKTVFAYQAPHGLSSDKDLAKSGNELGVGKEEFPVEGAEETGTG